MDDNIVLTRQICTIRFNFDEILAAVMFMGGSLCRSDEMGKSPVCSLATNVMQGASICGLFCAFMKIWGMD